MNNSSVPDRNSTGGRVVRLDQGMIDRIVASFYSLTIFYVIVGGLLCSWLLAAILSSADMRKRLRNQLVCLVCLGNILKTSVCGSIGVILRYNAERGLGFDCNVNNFSKVFFLVVEFAGSWYIVFLLIIFICQLIQYNPAWTLRPVILTVVKVLVQVVPFAIGLLIIPFVGYYHRRESELWTPCIILQAAHYKIFNILDYIVPMIICFALLVITTTLYYRRFHRGGISSSTTIRPELMGRGPPVDNVAAYIVVVCIEIVLCFLNSVRFLTQLHDSTDVNNTVMFYYSIWIIIDARAVFVPLAWLLLHDIRERVKTWRPWHRHRVVSDLDITYIKNRADDVE